MLQGGTTRGKTGWLTPGDRIQLAPGGATIGFEVVPEAYGLAGAAGATARDNPSTGAVSPPKTPSPQRPPPPPARIVTSAPAVVPSPTAASAPTQVPQRAPPPPAQIVPAASGKRGLLVVVPAVPQTRGVPPPARPPTPPPLPAPMAPAMQPIPESSGYPIQAAVVDHRAVPPPLARLGGRAAAGQQIPQTAPQTDWRKVGAAILAVLMVLGILSKVARIVGRLGGGGANVSYSEFIDNTARFKGDTLQFEMSLNTAGDQLWDYAGGRAEFYMFDSNAHGVIVIDIPANLNLPNATDADELLVTFDCNNGRLDSGNLARGIRRP